MAALALARIGHQQNAGPSRDQHHAKPEPADHILYFHAILSWDSVVWSRKALARDTFESPVVGKFCWKRGLRPRTTPRFVSAICITLPSGFAFSSPTDCGRLAARIPLRSSGTGPDGFQAHRPGALPPQDSCPPEELRAD